MELKKSPKADLQNKRSIFLLSGIAIAIGLTIGLFSWSQSEKKIETMAAVTEAVEQEMVDITVQDEKPKPEVPKTQTVVSEMINLVRNDAKITTEISFIDEGDLAMGKIEAKNFTGKSAGEAEVEDEIPVVAADKMPTFNGKDLSEFRNWVQKDLVYPQVAADNGIMGTVTINFVVERDGSVSNVKVVRGVDRELDAAAVKKVQSSPKWKPGENRGKPVRVTFTLPVQFKLIQ